MATTKQTNSISSIEFLLEQYKLPHYRWQAVLHLIRAGHKEGIPELDDLNAAMNYMKRDVACVQKERRSPQMSLSRPSRSRNKPVSKQVNATPSASVAGEAQASA